MFANVSVHIITQDKIQNLRPIKEQLKVKIYKISKKLKLFYNFSYITN